MVKPRQVRDWLSWLVRVRILVITFLLGIELVIRQFLPSPPVPIKYFLALILLWYTFSVIYAIVQRLELDPYLQAYVQLTFDLAVVTGLVYVTGLLDSYLVLLYPLVIIMASILLSRVGAFLVTALSFILFAGMANAEFFELLTLPQRRAPGSLLQPQGTSIWPLQAQLISYLFAFFGTWYLASQLAESLRKTGVELADTAGELEELQAFNENVIQSMRGGLLTTDLRGRILLLNPAGEEILETSQRSLRGHRLESSFPHLVDLLERRQAAPGQAQTQLRIRTARGKDRILGVDVSVLRTREGTESGYVYNFQDLTELKRLEAEVAQKERMATLGRLAAAIAHEVRNPLGAIAGSVRQLARYAQVGEDEQKLVDIVNRESERLNRLVNEILSFSKQRAPRREKTNLVSLFEESLLLLKRHPRFNESIEVKKEFPSAGLEVDVDSAQMKQLFWNLCDNALQAMPKGGTLAVGLEEQNGRVRIQVSDTGVGLTPEQCEKIFEPFEGKFVGGTGLGLAIVYQIVQSHGGRVWASPAQPSGSQFTVELPRG